jgi:hypothetical protein
LYLCIGFSPTQVNASLQVLAKKNEKRNMIFLNISYRHLFTCYENMQAFFELRFSREFGISQQIDFFYFCTWIFCINFKKHWLLGISSYKFGGPEIGRLI